MLTSFEIENFKAIAARQRIDFAPLTLLFGANSAGKSTILQALLYMHELLERGSADIDRTSLGGDTLEFGGFARLVHQHDTSRAIVLRAEFATPGGLERFGRDLTDFPFPDLDDEVDSAWIEVTIRYRTTATFRGPIVERAAIGVNGAPEPLVWLEVGTSLREGEPLHARVNLEHPIIAEPVPAEVARPEVTWPTGETEPLSLATVDYETLIGWDSISLPFHVLRSAHHVDGVAFGVAAESEVRTAFESSFGHDSGFGNGRAWPVFAVKRTRLSALPALGEPLSVVPFGDDSPGSVATAQQVRTFLEMVVLGTTTQLAGFLRDALYIGPLRAIPKRGFLYERTGRVESWADGLAAWDLLLADRLTLVDRTNEWLRRLRAGCQVVVQQLFEGGTDAEEISLGHVDKTVRRLLLDTSVGSYVLPSEVGAGISQLIPVVVAAMEGRYGLTLVEQPEIHVHPAVQVGLGDLFLEAATRETSRRVLLVETHSEHLLLRIMRRMRETAEGNLPDGMRPVRPDDVSIVLVEKNRNQSIARKMPLNERGELVKAWPGGFFEEGLREVF